MFFHIISHGLIGNRHDEHPIISIWDFFRVILVIIITRSPLPGPPFCTHAKPPRASGRFHNTWTARSPGGVPAVRFSRFAGTTPGKSAQSPGAGASRRPRPPLKPQPRAGEGLIPPPRSSALFLRRAAVSPLTRRALFDNRSARHCTVLCVMWGADFSVLILNTVVPPLPVRPAVSP